MTDREVFVARYHRALERIGMARLMNLPSSEDKDDGRDCRLD